MALHYYPDNLSQQTPADAVDVSRVWQRVMGGSGQSAQPARETLPAIATSPAKSATTAQTPINPIPPNRPFSPLPNEPIQPLPPENPNKPFPPLPNEPIQPLPPQNPESGNNLLDWLLSLIQGGRPDDCMGEDGRIWAYYIVHLMNEISDDEQQVRALARRTQNKTSRDLLGLAANLHRQMQELAAAHFLLVGKRHAPPISVPSQAEGVSNQLRQLYSRLNTRAATAEGAAQESKDRCLTDLFHEVALSARENARQVRNIVSQLG